MNRIIKAIIEQIQEDLSLEELTKFYVSYISSVVDDTPNDKHVTVTLTSEEFHRIGSVWNEPALFKTILSETTGRLIHEVYGDMILAASRGAEDVLAAAGAVSKYADAAMAAAAAELDRKYPTLPVDRERAHRALGTSEEKMHEMLSALSEAAAEVMATSHVSNDHVVMAAPSTLQ